MALTVLDSAGRALFVFGDDGSFDTFNGHWELHSLGARRAAAHFTNDVTGWRDEGSWSFGANGWSMVDGVWTYGEQGWLWNDGGESVGDGFVVGIRADGSAKAWQYEAQRFDLAANNVLHQTLWGNRVEFFVPVTIAGYDVATLFTTAFGRLDGHDASIASLSAGLTAGGAHLTTIDGRLAALEAAPPVVTTAVDFTVVAGNQWIKVTKATACVVTLPAANTWTGPPVHFKVINAVALSSASSNVKPMNSDIAGTAIVASGGGATIVADVPNNVWEVVS